MNRNKRKQQIMMASLQAFAKSGIQQTNISELVRAAQVSRGTFYLYFSNKEELLYNSLEHFYSQILALVDSLDFTLVKQREDYDAVVQDFASKLTEVIMPFGFFLKRLMLEMPEHKNLSKGAQLFSTQLRDILAARLPLQIDALRLEVTIMCLVGGIKESVMRFSSQRNYISMKTRLVEVSTMMLSNLYSDLNTNHITQDQAYLAQNLDNSTSLDV
jgi:AcrR family transcriptional regulator